MRSIRRRFATSVLFLYLAGAPPALSQGGIPTPLPLPVYQCVNLRSGANQGITFLTYGNHTFPIVAQPFNSTHFSAAASGPPAVQVIPYGLWLYPLPANNAAEWIAIDANLTPASTLFSQAFTGPTCNIQSATLQLWFATDDQLGDNPFEMNTVGVYLNGNPIPGFSGGNLNSQTYLFSSNVAPFLQPGTNHLQIYVRDLGATVSGVIYSARICWTECQPGEQIRLRSGNGPIGGPDSQIRYVAGTGAQPISATTLTPGTDPLFFSACAGPPANVIAPFGGLWCASLSSDPLAKWIASDPFAFGRSALFCQSFNVKTCQIQSATIKFDCSVDDDLGEFTAPNNVGLYLNGLPVPGSFLPGNIGQTCNLSFTGNVTGLLNPGGANKLQVYVRDTDAMVSGILYSAWITIVPCATPEIIDLRSNGTSAIRFLAGPPQIPLTASAFNAANFAAAQAGPPAVAVNPLAVWCQGLPDPLAGWISTSSGWGPASALYAHPFTVTTCPADIKSVKLEMTFCADDGLGDLPAWGGPNLRGVYINGNPVIPSGPLGNYGTSTSFTAYLPPSWVTQGPNTMYVYNRDRNAAASGVMYTAKITIVPCSPVRVIGVGCGTSNPTMAIARTPEIGGVLDLRIMSAASMAPAASFFGASETSWNGIPLPFDLTAIGFVGCNLYAPMSFLLPTVVTDANGEAGYVVAIPPDPFLANLDLFFQSFVADLSGVPDWLTFTPGQAVTVSRP